MTLRLDKFLSEQTEKTRSEIKKLILRNRVTIDGAVCRDGSRKIDPDTDTVALDGENVAYRDKVYYILNKPAGYVCATEDKRERTVLELLEEKDRRKDLFPAGRLDKDTLGMTLITNDGKLSHSILSPRHHIPKFYIVKLAESFKAQYVKEFEKSIQLDGGEVCMPAKLRAFENAENTALIEISEGKYHQIKRMFAAVGNKVIKLKRVGMGGLLMPVKLGLGDYVEIMHKDVERLSDNPDFGAVFAEIRGNFSSYWINI